MTVSPATRPELLRRVTRITIQWLLPLALVVFAGWSGHLGDAARALRSVDLWLAATLVVIGLALPVSHAWRWRFLLKRTGASIELGPAVDITAQASLINYAAPGYLGAPAKAALARQSHGISVSRSAPTLIVEQTLDALLLAIAGGAALILAGPTVVSAIGGGISAREVVITLAIFAVALTGAVAVYVLIRWRRPESLAALRLATGQVLTGRADRVVIAAGTMARWILDMLAFWVAALAVGLSLSVVDLLLIGNLSLLVGVLSPFPGGLGAREATMAALGAAVGLSIPVVLAMAVLHRAGLGLALPALVIACRGLGWGQR